MFYKVLKKFIIFTATVVALNLLLITLFEARVCEANLVGSLTNELVGVDVTSILNLVLHLTDIKKTLDPLIHLLQILVPLLGQISDILGLLDKLDIL